MRTGSTAPTAEPPAPTFSFDVHFQDGPAGHRQLVPGPAPKLRPLPRGRVPRVSRLMALAIRFDREIRDGYVRDFRELARLGGVSCARVTQIMNLLLLAPDIQEEILGMPRVERGREKITEKKLRAVVAMVDWGEQREAWRRLSLLAN